MSHPLILDGLLIISVLILGWMSIFSATLFRCIVFFVCFGLLVTIAWAQMNAIDVAIAEAAIGAGITGALLIAAWIKVRPEQTKTNIELTEERSSERTQNNV